ncbi:hypothetical protein [Photobacterium damselae]|uniref:hypothetical protein n=2 Tax=Photobacterium damselae TaxID=38293 RepID=UPI0002B616F2|nr:hypothetical protein [Photobacterium damselae]AGE91769.1 hypothetical protein A613_p45 [Photobacterium damselae subsp. piscicida DI21]
MLSKVIKSIILTGIASHAYAESGPQVHWKNDNNQQQIIITNLPQIVIPLQIVQQPQSKKTTKSHAVDIQETNKVKPLPNKITKPIQHKPQKSPKNVPDTPLLKKMDNSSTQTVEKPKPPITSIVSPQYYVSQGQTYMTAIRNWLTQSKLSRVAWSLPPATVAALNTPSSNGNLFKGDIESVIKQVGDKLGKPLYFSRNAKGMAAIHNIKGSVDILWINGATIKDAVKNLTLQYHWQWKNGDNSSWMAPDNYTLIAPYPVVAPRGDFAYALNTVLDGYPVQAQLLYATKNIFVVEKE